MTSMNTSARTAWVALSPDEQYESLRRMAATVPRRCDKHGWNYAAWMGQRESWEDSVELVAGGAFMDMDAVLEKAGDKPLAVALAFAALSAAQKLGAFYRPHSKARAGSPESVTEEELDRLPCWNTERPETLAILRDAVERMCMDDLDRRIAALAYAGDGQEVIAQKTGVNQSSVSRRLKKMRIRFDG